MADGAAALKKGALCTVIGASGCLGRELVSELLRRGYRVNAFDLRPPTVEDELVKYFTGSITEREDLLPALTDVDAVFHAASPGYFIDDQSLFYKVNVEGTKNVIRCCIDCNVPRLVGTSSAIVIFRGEDNCGKTEDELPYATPVHSDLYQASKIAMEKLVLAADGTQLSSGMGKLWTSAIRPQGLFGPGDGVLIPHIQKSKGITHLSDGTNRMDYVYSTNLAYGHILAAEKLHDGGPACGQVFNISNDDPVLLRDFTDEMCVGVGFKPGVRTHWVVVAGIVLLAHIMVMVQAAFRAIGFRYKLPFTPLQCQMGMSSQWHSIDKAKRLLGYKPLVSMEEGKRRTLEFYRTQRRDEEKKKAR